ncbi:MAG: glycosyltransferase family 4 protein [Chthoniobacterales bacterium]
MSNTSQSGAIYFFKYGTFSHVNERVVEILRREFPDNELRVVDAVAVLRHRPWLSLFFRIYGSLRHLGVMVRNKNSPWDFVFRYTAVWNAFSDWIAKNISPEETRFIIQTQSLFDASHPRIPFYIYTDHTHAAHKRHFRGGSPTRVSHAWREKEKALYRRADAVFTFSEFCAFSLREDYGLPADRVRDVRSGINIPLPEKLAPLDPDKSIVIFVGIGWRRKGGPQLVEAFKTVRREIPGAELWIVGSKPEQTTEGMRYYGRVDKETMGRLLSEATVYCMPSLLEPAVMVILDAAAYGLPVIMTSVGGSSERLEDGVTGLLVPPDDVPAIAQALLRILKDRELAKRMGQAGRKMVEEKFSWKVTGSAMAETIHKIETERRLSEVHTLL